MLNGFVPEQRSPLVTTNQYPQRESIWRILVDILCLIILLVITLLSHYVAKPFSRGFFCSDTTIQYSYKPNTIPTYAAVLLSLLLPLFWMWITEVFKLFYFKHYTKQMSITRLEFPGDRYINVSPFFRNLYILTVVFLYGYLATWVLTEIAKNFVGELRPHFRAVCQPTYNCSVVTSLSEFNRYLQYEIDYTCQNPNASSVREARRSFFSGHSSSIFYGFAWLIMYIHIAWSWRHLGILGHLFQVGLAILASYVAYTRLTDYHHHWQDVLVGILVGSLIAFVSFKFILNWRNYTTRYLSYTVDPQQNVRSIVPMRLGLVPPMYAPFARGPYIFS